MGKITSRGQITIPKEIREELGLLPETEVEFVVRGNGVQIVKAKTRARGEDVVLTLRGRATRRLSTAQIMKMMRG